ncbi:MAG: DinB family protein [Acidobacteriota bacterium]
MTSEQASFLRDFMLQGLEEEFGATCRVLAAVPDENVDYRPDAKSRTARELAWHIVEGDIQFLSCIGKLAFAFGEEKADPTEGMAEMIAYYEAGFKDTIGRIRALTPEELAAPVDFMGIFNYPAVSYLTFFSNHSIHHRGQLTTYLRPMGGKVPAVYGPSADEQWTSE